LNPIRLAIIAAAFVIATVAYNPHANAQAAKTPTETGLGTQIAVLDLDAIRRDALAVKDIRAQIVEFQKSFRTDIQKEEEALRAANQELAKKRSILAPEAFAEERRKFEQKVVAVQRLVQERKRGLDKAQSDAMLNVEVLLNKIIGEIATSRKLGLVLRRQQTILASRSLEITGDVLKQLNQRLPKVKVKKPEK